MSVRQEGAASVMLPRRQHSAQGTHTPKTVRVKKNRSLDDVNRSAEVTLAPRAPPGLFIRSTNATWLSNTILGKSFTKLLSSRTCCHRLGRWLIGVRPGDGKS